MRVVLLLSLVAVWSGCNPAHRQNSSGSASTDIGITVIPPLTAEVATNRAQFLERLNAFPKTTAFESRTLARPNAPEEQLKYLLFKPRSYNPQTNYPLVLSLHGGALRHNFEEMTNRFAYGLGRFISDETQNAHPCFVLAPWSDNTDWDPDKLKLVIELIDALQKEFKIDGKRIYVTGQSMGGFGTWSAVTQYPERFAAAVPICGGGEPKDAANASDIPIWAFHGTADKMVVVQYTRQMITALNKAGGKPLYWEYQDGDHSGTAERAYCEPDLVSWMFSKAKP